MKQNSHFRTLKAVSVAALFAAAGCASTQNQQAPGEYVDDTTLTGQVKTALIADPIAQAHQIEVETYRGVVQLSGFVDSQNERVAAVKVAEGVRGVKSVHDNLKIRTEDATVGDALDDSVVSARVKTALIANPVTKARQINVATADGVVQLSGFVDSANEKTTATEVARTVPGVRLVQNELEMKPAP
jgi:hyperosmotically inducible periplasmic protein